MAWAAKQGEIAAQELRALGTDINFSPCLDVLTQSYSPNIGIRSFGKDYKLVADMGAAYIMALQKDLAEISNQPMEILAGVKKYSFV